MLTATCEQLQPHEPPDGYRYETVRQKTNVLAVWIVSIRGFLYNDNYPARSIWGFYNSKTKQYHAPINSKKIGAIVQLEKTSPYSAMQIKRIGLEQFM